MRRRRKQRRMIGFCDELMREKLKYWILKILLELNGMQKFCDLEGYISDTHLLEFLEFKNFEQKNHICVDPKELLRTLKENYQFLKNKKKLKSSRELENNLSRLKRFFNLSKNEVKVLEFLLCLNQYKILEDSVELISDINTSTLFAIKLSVLLDIPKNEFEKIISPHSILCRTAMIELDSRCWAICISSDQFSSKMFKKITRIEELFEENIKVCSKTSLVLKDYDHLQEDVCNLYSYLKQVLLQKMKGVNILLYGNAGTGKTELVKAMSKALKASLYEVSYSNEEGECVDGSMRIGFYRIAQDLLRGRKLLMYDEAEDILYSDERFLQKGKAWINRSLENNNVPTFWITNKISKVDEAIVRRFDYVLHVPIPPKKKRKEILKKYCSRLIDEEMIESISLHERISPAMTQRASKVAETINTKEASKVFSKCLNNSLQAMGFRQMKTHVHLSKTYDLDLINTDMDMNLILEGLKRNPNARICLYGVPGSGKSAYGQYLAQSLNMPCILKKASDLLDMYVGETEKQIAQAFEEAKTENAVLIFDEVDSFLQNRSGAMRNWEITQVNEMLVQMEEFDGIFIATTNLVDNLDQACLRRFDLKLEFKYLKPSQAWKMFLKECETFGIREDQRFEEKIKSFVNISAGDFATIARQARFSPIVNCEDFYQRLVSELHLKSQAKSVGFL